MTVATNTRLSPKRSRNAVDKTKPQVNLRNGAAERDGADEASLSPDKAEAIADLAKGSAPAKYSKTAQVLDLLRRPEGATIEQLVKATGWLPHTTRAALTGLKKKGYAVARMKRDDVSVYSLVS